MLSRSRGCARHHWLCPKRTSRRSEETALTTPTRSRFIQHREEILRFWERAYDPEENAFYSWIGPTGETWRRHRLSLLIQARLLYNYSEGMRAGLSFAQTYAERLYACITERMRTPEGWYSDLHEGELAYPGMLEAYNNLFVVIGMARYAQAGGPPQAAEEAWRLFTLIEGNTIKGELAQTGLVGHMSGFSRISSREQFSGNINLHYLEALARLTDAGIGGDLRGRAEAIRSFFLRCMYDKEKVLTFDRFRDSFDEPWVGPGAYVSLGHTLEWVDFFRCFEGLQLDERMEREILDRTIERSVRDDGLFEDSYYLTEQRTAGGAEFWPQVEATKTYNMAASVYGTPYNEVARKLGAYYFDHFVDSDGGVFSEIDRNGVVTSRYKGGYWKCDYHSMRMCVDVAEREGGAFDG
ncbi:MAG: hypothetical protein GF331_14795 [Chitinivibrionales bacterium]|nr:hypothetical protein [Chitinivibrionales bacterium]